MYLNRTVNVLCRNFGRDLKFVNYAARQRRYRTTLPMNTIFLFVPTQEAWIIERFGKFKTILQPGLNIIYPIIDKIKYVQNLKEMAISIPQQSAITKDNVTVRIDGILYVKVSDPYLACYGVDDPEFAITQLAQTTMRSEIGKISLDSLFRERESLNATIVESINKASTSWGLDCKRYEIRDIDLPVKVQEAMQTQVEAERKKRASILESEGVRDSQINIANGKREAVILSSEAYKIEQINRAEGESNAIIQNAKAKAETLLNIAEAIKTGNGANAASYEIAIKYISAFSNVAKTGNTILLPSNMGDMSGAITQAMTIFKTLTVSDKSENVKLNGSRKI